MDIDQTGSILRFCRGTLGVSAATPYACCGEVAKRLESAPVDRLLSTDLDVNCFCDTIDWDVNSIARSDS